MRILIVKTSSLGDIIHAFPVLRFLHHEFPAVKVDWVVEKKFADLVKAHPLIENVIEMDTKAWRKKLLNLQTWKDLFDFRKKLQKNTYDAVIDLQGNTKSAIPTFLAQCANKIGYGFKTIQEWPNMLATHQRFNPPLYLNVRDENLYVVQHYFQRYSSVEDETVVLKMDEAQQKLHDQVWAKIKKQHGQKILVCPGSAWKNKQLSFEALHMFLQRLHEHLNASLILAWGTPEEFALVQRLQEAVKGQTVILDKVSLPVLQNIMSKMDHVIAMDSLPLHLAGISGIPTFSVFGASSAQKYKPRGDFHRAVQGPCPYKKVFERRCPLLRSCKTGLCIRSLSGEDLFKEFCESGNFNPK